MARHSAALAQQVAEGGAVAAAVACLQQADAVLQEAAGGVLANIAGHTAELAGMVVGQAASPLAACLSSPELAVRRAAAFALSELARHSEELAQRIADVGAVPRLVEALQSGEDAKLSSVRAGPHCPRLPQPGSGSV